MPEQNHEARLRLVVDNSRRSGLLEEVLRRNSAASLFDDLLKRLPIGTPLAVSISHNSAMSDADPLSELCGRQAVLLQVLRKLHDADVPYRHIRAQELCATLAVQGVVPQRYTFGMADGNRIEAIRLAKDLTQEQLAEMCGTSHSTIQRLEKGERRLSDRWIWKLSKALNCHPGELFAELPAPDEDPELALALRYARQMDRATRALWLQVGGLMAVPERAAKPSRKSKN